MVRLEQQDQQDILLVVEVVDQPHQEAVNLILVEDKVVVEMVLRLRKLLVL
jgi:hypothetical protein